MDEIDVSMIDCRDALEWIDSLSKDRDRELVYKFTRDNEVMFSEWLCGNYAEEIAIYRFKKHEPEYENDL